MDSTYLYSGTYASVLTSRLLTEAKRELLLSSTSLSEVRTILQDTVIAPYLSDTSDLKSATRGFLVAEIATLRRLAPDPQVMSILLLRHDYYNLKYITLGIRTGLSGEAILKQCRDLGTIKPERLLRLIETNTLRFTHPELGTLYRTLSESATFPHALVDETLLRHMHQLASAYPDSFVSQYVAVIIDLYNLRMRLRVLVNPDSNALAITGTFVLGGTMTSAGLASLDSTLIRLERFGGAGHWREACETFATHHDFSAIDKAADDYLHRFLKSASIAIHSPAPLFAYYHAVIEHVQFIDAVITAHTVGLDNATLRSITRHSLLDYAY